MNFRIGLAGAKKTVALHNSFLYYSSAGFLLLLLWNPVF